MEGRESVTGRKQMMRRSHKAGTVWGALTERDVADPLLMLTSLCHLCGSARGHDAPPPCPSVKRHQEARRSMVAGGKIFRWLTPHNRCQREHTDTCLIMSSTPAEYRCVCVNNNNAWGTLVCSHPSNVLVFQPVCAAA